MLSQQIWIGFDTINPPGQEAACTEYLRHLLARAGFHCEAAPLAEGRPNRIEATGPGPMGPTRVTLSKPVIAAVAGYAVAGGLELALWCDLRVVEEDATFGVFCRRWGVPLIDGGTYRLPRIVGLGRALDLMLTGREFDADEAYDIGFAARVVPDGTALATAVEMAEKIASFPWPAVVHDRMSAYEGLGMDLAEGLANEDRHGREVIFGAGFLDGVARFEERPR